MAESHHAGDRDGVLAAVAAHLAQRDALVAAVASGALDVREIISESGSSAHGVGESTRVLVLLDAAPGSSKVASRRLLATLGVAELAVLGDLAPDRRRELAAGLQVPA